MTRFLTRFAVAACCLLLASCKSESERNITAERYAAAVGEINKALPPSDLEQSVSTDYRSRFGSACVQLSLLGPDTQLTGLCRSVLNLAFFAPANPKSLEQETAIWTAFAEEQDRERYLPELAAEVEAIRSAIAARVVAEHWRWSSAVQSKIKMLGGAVNASMGSSFEKETPAEIFLASAGPSSLAKLKNRLDQERLIVAEIGRAEDPLQSDTLASLATWNQRIADANKAVSGAAEFEKEVVTEANNEAWAAAIADTSQINPAVDLEELAIIEGRMPPPSGFNRFIAQASAFDFLVSKSGAVSGPALPIFTDDAAAYLVDDCSTLLGLDQKAFDEVCGAAATALSDALDLLKGNFASRNFGTDGSDPDSTFDPTAPVPTEGITLQELVSLKAKLREARIVSDFHLSDKVRSEVVAELTASIKESTKAYVEASLAGHMEEVARTEARLELIHEALRKAVDGALPPRLADPFSLLSQEEIQQVQKETLRLQRLVQRTENVLPDLPEFEIAAKALAEQSERLARIINAPAGKDDLADVIRRIDPSKAKVLYAEVQSQLASAAERRVKLWADRFQGLPVVIDTWRGPRGPPAPDPDFPRSRRVLAAIGALGRNPTEAIHAFSALKAEHFEFYASVDGGDRALVESWKFGRTNVSAWMVSLMSPRDLAVASNLLRAISIADPKMALAEGWVELAEATNQLDNAIVEESRLRAAAGSRHPPGYPPGRPPPVKAAAERYALGWSDRAPTPIETQMRFQLAQRTFADVEAMPLALQGELRAIAQEIVDTDTERNRNSGG